MSVARPRTVRRFASTVVVLGGLLAPPPLWAASPAETLLAEWVETLRANGADVRWGALVEGEQDLVTLTDVEIAPVGTEAERNRIVMPTVVLQGLAAGPEGGFGLRSLRVPRLEVKGTPGGETFVVAVTDVEVADLTVPRIVVPAFDPDRPVASAIDRGRAFDGIALGRAAVGRATLSGGAQGSGKSGSVTASDLTLGGLAAGRLERFRLGRFETEATEQDQKARFSVDALEIDGWDPSAWIRVFDDRSYAEGRGDGVWRPFLGGARSGRVVLDSGDGAISIERFVSGARSVRPFPEPLGGTFERFVRDADHALPADALRVVLELFLATRHEGWAIEGLRISGRDIENAEIGRLAFGSFSPAGLSEVSIEQVDFTANKAILRLGRFVLADLRLPDAEDLRRALPAALAGAEIDPSSIAPTLGGLRLENLEVSEPGIPSIRLGLFSLDLSRHLRAIPTVLGLTVDHFVVPAGLADSESRATLAGLGYDRVDLSLSGRLEWLEAKRELVLEGGRVAIADAGEAAITARLTGVGRSLFLRPDTLPLALGGIGLAEATATFTDASFVDRLVRLIAKDEKMKPDRLRRRLADEIAAETKVIRDPSRRKAITAAVRDFVLRPGVLTVVARPKRPLPLPELLALGDDPSVAAEKLELSVTTSR